VSTINGDANVPFYKELANAGIKADAIPVVAFSVGEEELAGIDTKNLVGHLAAWNYFESVKNPTNDAFIKQWHDFIKNPKRVTNDPMEAHYIGFKMWTQAVRQAGTTDVDAVRQVMYGQKVKAPSGFVEVMNTNQHLSMVPVMRCAASASAKKGEVTCVLGRNGVGKTSLLRAIFGLQPIRAGRITWEGRVLNDLPPHERARSGLALVPQGREIFTAPDGI